MRVFAVFNRDSGTFRGMDMPAFCMRAEHAFTHAGHEFEYRLIRGRQLSAALNTAARHGPNTLLVAGGGDGTISAAAAVAFQSGLTLGIVPAGTMNLFARAVGIPLNPDQAIEALATGELAAVDMATVNGRPFVHQFSVGIHSRLVKIREGFSYRSRLGKMLASLRAIASAVIRPPLFELEIGTSAGRERLYASAVCVSNNPIEEGHVPHAASVDGGMLGVYLAKPMSSWAMAKLCLSVLFGHWKGNPLVSERAVEEVTLRFPRRNSSAKAVIDGELTRLPREVHLKIHPIGLAVMVPARRVRVAA